MKKVRSKVEYAPTWAIAKIKSLESELQELKNAAKAVCDSFEYYCLVTQNAKCEGEYDEKMKPLWKKLGELVKDKQ